MAFLIFSYSVLHFNPRPREEGDFGVRERLIFRQYFNPRPREEGDTLLYALADQLPLISIHALVKRATRAVRNK